ncbi:hypothetical protein BC834DRAFT_1021901 [Gloeopeniophorella convolvens]|nr:hypothetical protein BC834DRAFT_1021901 [Gloeopeniophorella convolvens]
MSSCAFPPSAPRAAALPETGVDLTLLPPAGAPVLCPGRQGDHPRARRVGLPTYGRTLRKRKRACTGFPCMACASARASARRDATSAAGAYAPARTYAFAPARVVAEAHAARRAAPRREAHEARGCEMKPAPVPAPGTRCASASFASSLRSRRPATTLSFAVSITVSPTHHDLFFTTSGPLRVAPSVTSVFFLSAYR